MAISKNPNLEGFRGTIDKTIVVRIDPWGRSILSSYPDMSNIVPTITQKQQRLNFKEAQTIALKMLSDPKVKAFYQEKCEGRQRPHRLPSGPRVHADRRRGIHQTEEAGLLIQTG